MTLTSMLADLTIEVSAREIDGELRTMSQYQVPRNGKLVFRNAAAAPLQVTPKSGQPFCEADKKTVIDKVIVRPNGGEQTVYICEAFEEKEDEFLYTAEVEGALPEDPIVIIDKR